MDYSTLDFKPELNTSSFVNVVQEPEEAAISLAGLHINLADQTVYPGSYSLHNAVVNLTAQLWNCPAPSDGRADYAGAVTVGSTEACLLAGLAFKFRWRAWNAAKKGITDPNEARRAIPNLVISTTFQAAWEKLFKYMDIEPRFVIPDVASFRASPEAVTAAIDENTCGVVAILGNHYQGGYDDVQAISAAVKKANDDKGLDIGIHVDAASGGFVAPFQPEMADQSWDFRNQEVLSISGSGHKFGESIVGTGLIVWRDRKDLAEHVAISVSYLGGVGESYTLNFSRPASGPMVMLYKYLRLGRSGYEAKVSNQMHVAKFLRDGLLAMTSSGKPRFIICDDGDQGCLPVVAGYLNPALDVAYDDIDLQHQVSERHWYVSAYPLSFHDPVTAEVRPLFSDASVDRTMFRIVVKSNLTMPLARDLLSSVEEAVEFLDKVNDGYLKVHNEKLGKGEQGRSGHVC